LLQLRPDLFLVGAEHHAFCGVACCTTTVNGTRPHALSMCIPASRLTGMRYFCAVRSHNNSLEDSGLLKYSSIFFVYTLAGPGFFDGADWSQARK
jgi:hypothetical protein